MKNKVPLTSDEELWDLMCDVFIYIVRVVKMSSESQQRILQNIYANDEEEKRQTRVRRFLSLCGDVRFDVVIGRWQLFGG